MLYDSLLLHYGGGIIAETTKAMQQRNSAALMIGIGGAGVDTLSELRGKIHQQLQPDNPGEPVAKYEGIQLLGIDSDEVEHRQYRGNCRLRDEEFFSISARRLGEPLWHKEIIKEDPRMNWMAIDEIAVPPLVEGAGCIRQIGRFLLISNAGAVCAKIQSKCMAALQAYNEDTLDVYIFAGLSGGTGSGCFLDVCYLIRRIARFNNWNVRIFGYFFMPDVLISKAGAAARPAEVANNNANGYAALKELDYLMSLKSANDRFAQNYGNGLQVDTQEPPVDMCHLISAVNENGAMMPNGYTYAINVAADAVMPYLTAANENEGISLQGYRASLYRCVDFLPRTYGANLSYHILGACNAEVPVNQILTYLAAGYYDKFMQTVTGEGTRVTRSAVQDLQNELRLSAGEVYKSVIREIPSLVLPAVDSRVLIQGGMPGPGRLNDAWAKAGNDWFDRCMAKMTVNVNGLTQELESYDYNKTSTASLIGRLFHKLWELSVDPNFGPYYAAQLLHNGSDDLQRELDGTIGRVVERQRICEHQLEDALRCMEEAKAAFYNSTILNRKRLFEKYEYTVTQYFLAYMAIFQHKNTVDVLYRFKGQVQKLYKAYVSPLCSMLENLKETFQENRYLLEQPNGAVMAVSPHILQIVSVQDLKPNLDAVIEELDPKKLVCRFVDNLLANSDAWLFGDSDKITQLIRDFMLSNFQMQMGPSLLNCLFEKYPDARNDMTRLANLVYNDILERAHHIAAPAFWSHPAFAISNPNVSYPSGYLFTPQNAIPAQAAVDRFCENHREYRTGKTSGGNRIFVMRQYSGIPLYAYNGINYLKVHYDCAEEIGDSAGRHLYANTGRGTDGTGTKDWHHFLPDPVPLSWRKANQ